VLLRRQHVPQYLACFLDQFRVAAIEHADAVIAMFVDSEERFAETLAKIRRLNAADDHCQIGGAAALDQNLARLIGNRVEFAALFAPECLLHKIADGSKHTADNIPIRALRSGGIVADQQPCFTLDQEDFVNGERQDVADRILDV
jgi:hypothetical protein